MSRRRVRSGPPDSTRCLFIDNCLFHRRLAPIAPSCEWPGTGLPIPCSVLSPRHHGLLIMPSSSSLPAALVITRAAILQSATQIPIRSTLCHCVPQSRPPRLPQPIHTPLVTMNPPKGKSLAHSALLQLQGNLPGLIRLTSSCPLPSPGPSSFRRASQGSLVSPVAGLCVHLDVSSAQFITPNEFLFH